MSGPVANHHKASNPNEHAKNVPTRTSNETLDRVSIRTAPDPSPPRSSCMGAMLGAAVGTIPSSDGVEGDSLMGGASSVVGGTAAASGLSEGKTEGSMLGID